MRIIYFSYLYDIKGVSAGSANKAIGFIDGLRARGHEVKIFWRSVQPEDLQGSSPWWKVRNTLKMHLSRYLHDPKKVLSNLKYFFQEYRILNKEKPDIFLVRSELYNFSAVLVARVCGISVVLEVDCPTVYEHRTISGVDKIKLPLLPEWIERWNWKASDAILVISNVLKDYLMRHGVSERKITLIPNGADPNKFRPGLKGKSLRNQYGQQDQVVIGWMLGWIGPFFRSSGLVNLLGMSKKILKMRENVSFLFIGGGKNKEILEGIFEQKDIDNRVILTGTVPYDEVPKYFDMMDIAVAPYPKLDFWYISSMKVFEYMSSQKAVVASAVGQITEIIQDGVNGFLFDPDDMDGFVDKILRLVDERKRREKMAENARKTVLQKYTWVKHAEEMEEVFRSVLNKQ
jgi:glycosyltransferase involved in cell wall biosynthesis